MTNLKFEDGHQSPVCDAIYANYIKTGKRVQFDVCIYALCGALFSILLCSESTRKSSFLSKVLGTERVNVMAQFYGHLHNDSNVEGSVPGILASAICQL